MLPDGGRACLDVTPAAAHSLYFLPEVLGGCFADPGGEVRVDGGTTAALLLID